MKSHTITARVYYEDTDAGGIMYHANHLKFAERGRTEWLRALGINQQALKESDSLLFVVASLSIDYQAPALLDDTLTVTTSLAELGRARLTLKQDITRGDTAIAALTAVVACIGTDGRLARMPEALYNKLNS